MQGLHGPDWQVMIQERSTQASSSSSDIRVSTLSAPFTHSQTETKWFSKPRDHPYIQTVRMRRCPGKLLIKLASYSWRCRCPLMSFFYYYFNKHYNECMIKRCRIQCQCILRYPNPNLFCSRESIKTPWRTWSLNSVRRRSLCFAVHVSVLWRGV